MADGFFLYGRKCNSTGDYPEDLDASGGQTASYSVITNKWMVVFSALNAQICILD